MNKEQLIQDKTEQLSELVGYINSTEDTLEKLMKNKEDLMTEIAELKKPEEVKKDALTFSQLAKKYEHPFEEILEREEEGVHGWTKFQAAFTEKEARRFAAEVYLTLLMRELNGDWIADYSDEQQTKYVPYWDGVNKKITHYATWIQYSPINFQYPELFYKALSYSEESKMFFLWYFGADETK